MQIRAGDVRARSLVEAVTDDETAACLRAEREFLRLLHGDCNQPVGVVAVASGNIIKMYGQVFRTDAAAPRAASVAGNREDAESLAADLLKRING